MKILNLLSVTMILLVVLSSCKKDEDFTPKDNDEVENQTLVENGYFHFQNWEEFNAKLVELNNMQSMEFMAYEGELGFESFFTDHEMYRMECKSKAEEIDFTSTEQHIEFMNEISNRYPCVSVVEFNDGGKYLRVNLFNEKYARIINKEGIVGIGEFLYKFGHQSYEIIGSIDDSRLKEKVPVEDYGATDPDNGPSGAKYPPYAISSVEDVHYYHQQNGVSNQRAEMDDHKIHVWCVKYSDNTIVVKIGTYHTWNWGTTWNGASAIHYSTIINGWNANGRYLIGFDRITEKDGYMRSYTFEHKFDPLTNYMGTKTYDITGIYIDIFELSIYNEHIYWKNVEFNFVLASNGSQQ